MNTNNATALEALDERSQQVKELERIEGIKGRAERWRAIQQLMFKINPETVATDRLHCASVNALRLQQKSVTGASTSGGIRNLYSMPEYLYRALQSVDPEFQKLQASGDAQTTRRFNRQIWVAFPEYRVAEKI